MQVFTFPCPHCAATLRVKDRRFLDRQVHCPDCRRPLLIVDDGRRGMTGRLPQADFVADASGSAGSGAASGWSAAGGLRQWAEVLRSPVGVAWTVAGGMAIVFLVLLWPAGDASEPPPLLTAPLRHANETPQDTQPGTWQQPAATAAHDPADAPSEPTELGTAPQALAVGEHAESSPADAAITAAQPTAEAQPAVAEVAAPNHAQAAPPAAIAESPPQPVDIQRALSQPIVSFRVARPVAARDLLAQVEEMAGVPIRVDTDALGRAAANLDRPVSLQLERTTVGGILEELLRRIELGYEAEANGLRLRAAAD